jgi:hypothetical protein
VPKPSRADLQFFRGLQGTQEIAAQLLGREFRDEKDAVEALATLAADPAALRELLARLPGGALEALRALTSERYPLSEAFVIARLDGTLGKDRGADAFRSLRGRGFLGVTAGQPPRYQIWMPLHAPIVAALAGLDIVAGPQVEAAVVPDQAGLAVALLLGHLWRTTPRVKQDGALYKKEIAELDRVFGPALGAGVGERFVHAFHALGLAQLDVTEIEFTASYRFAPAGDAVAFLEEPRAARVRAFAECCHLPHWLAPAFAAGEGLITRKALRRAAGGRAAQPDDPYVDAVLGYCLATGILEEHPGGLRVSPELRGQPGPERPAGGRWLVQPNLELIVPPDVPLADAFRLACFAEVASLDRAAVLRLTPASLAQASQAGLSAEEIEARLSARAGAPVPELVARAIRDGARVRDGIWMHSGTVVVAPADARDALRAQLAALSAEIAPGVFLLDEGAERKAGKAMAALGLRVHQRSTHYQSSVTPARAGGAQALRELLATPPIAPADPRLVEAVRQARSGDPAAFELAARPATALAARAAPVPGAEPDLNDLLDELVDRLERGGRIDLALLPPAERPLFMERMGKVLDGRVIPDRYDPSFARSLLRVLRGAPANPDSNATTSGLADSLPTPPATLDPAWVPIALQAVAERLDLWIGLSDERRPRLVTPHRVVPRGQVAELLALTHDSGDLRAFAGSRVSGAALGGPSDAARLPGAGGGRPILRAARNERCPCGSGRKYKSCCLPADLAAATG